jgi:hypothetical protein
MRRLIAVLAASAGLAGCEPEQVPLALDPGFYPSAIAHDRTHDRFFVASHGSGEIVSVRRDGVPAGTVRGPGAPKAIIQLAFDAKTRRLWVLTPGAVELIEPEAGPERRSVVATAPPGGRYVDLIIADLDRAFVLDAARREVFEVSRRATGEESVIRLPAADRTSATIAATAGFTCATPRALDDGALAFTPDRSALIAALDGRLWRVDPGTGEVAEVRLDEPLPYVSQLVALDHNRFTALRGLANEVVTLELARDGRSATVEGMTRARLDTPFQGAFDGERIVVLLGRLRHHPSLCGDGRPNLPPRLVAYAPSSAGGSSHMTAWRR